MTKEELRELVGRREKELPAPHYVTEIEIAQLSGLRTEEVRAMVDELRDEGCLAVRRGINHRLIKTRKS